MAKHKPFPRITVTQPSIYHQERSKRYSPMVKDPPNEPPRLRYKELKCVDSQGAMPHYSHFKPKEQVLVRYKSGHLCLGTVIAIKNMRNKGPREILCIYFRDVRHGRTRVLAGQMCTCHEYGSWFDRYGWKKPCPVHADGI